MKLQHMLGGLEGLGPVLTDTRVFAEEWEKGIFGIHTAMMALSPQLPLRRTPSTFDTVWTWADLRKGAEAMNPFDYFKYRYYEKWLGGISGYFVANGYISQAELDARTEEFLGDPEKPLPAGGATQSLKLADDPLLVLWQQLGPNLDAEVGADRLRRAAVVTRQHEKPGQPDETKGACILRSRPRPASRSNRPDTYQRLPLPSSQLRKQPIHTSKSAHAALLHGPSAESFAPRPLTAPSPVANVVADHGCELSGAEHSSLATALAAISAGVANPVSTIILSSAASHCS